MAIRCDTARYGWDPDVWRHGRIVPFFYPAPRFRFGRGERKNELVGISRVNVNQ
uniref:Uncharacterized protein n=1 Tax=Arundo donax TaxID=35708 RepID=A0A0A9HMD9_ARUDO